MIRPSRKLNIAVVSDAIYPYHRGGKETRIYQLTTQLARMGHDVHIYTMKWWEGDDNRIENGVHLHAISPLYPLYVGERRSIRQALVFFLACFKLVRYQFDILEIDHMPYFPLYAGKIVSLIKRRPMYATWHEVWGRKYWQNYLGPVAGLIGYALERFTIYLPTHIVAVSPHTADRLRSVLHYQKPVSIAPNGIDGAAIQKIKPATETSDIIYVGRLLAHKNVDVLIQAIAQLRQTHPHVRCIIGGNGPELDNLRALVAKLGLEQNVILKGTIATDTEKFALMKASRVFVLPSDREGFGIVALEAGVCGLPVVTIDHPDNAARHLITADNGALAQLDPTSLARAIDHVLTAQLKNNPTKLATEYDWQRIATSLSEVYAS